MKTQRPKTYGMQQKCSRRGVYNKTSLPQEGRKATNKQPKLTPRATRKIPPPPNLVERKKQIRAERISKEMKETIANINKTKLIL